MFTRLSLIGLAAMTMIAASTGCEHQKMTAANARGTTALAQGDAVGRTLLTPAGHETQSASARADLAPAD